MSRIPPEARDGLMRVWLQILRERHPGTTWLPAANDDSDQEAQQAEPSDELVAA